MNDLSWLLYAADVVQDCEVLAGLALAVLSVASLVLAVGWTIGTTHDDEQIYLPTSRALKWTCPVVVACALLVVITPSRETILLIAGSEAGEAVVTSEAGRETLTLVHDALKAQLRELAGTKGETE